MVNIANTIKTVLKQAEESGADVKQLSDLRRQMRMYFNWNPTKKVISQAKRKHLRDIQKESRRKNRGTGKGIKNGKGQRH